MSEVTVIDDHNMWLCLFITIGIQLLCFLIAYSCEFDLITDISGSTNFSILALLTLFLGNQYETRQIIITVLVLITRTELGLFLLYRVCKRSKDARFDEMRSNFFSFLGFWIFQMMWVFLVSMPVIYVNTDDAASVDIEWRDYLGIALFIVGFIVQVSSDLTKYQFRADPKNKGKFCTKGFWAYSRHPNFFGEILIWWGIFIISVPVILNSTNKSLGWGTIVSPLFTMWVLLFLSGLPTSEGKHLKRYYQNDDEGKAWEEYREQTAPVILCPPFIYRSLNMTFKRLFCFEFKFLEYKKEKEPMSESRV